MHESVHAFLGFSLRLNRVTDLRTEINSYYQSNNYSSNLAQHQFMSQFVDALALSLSVWDNRAQSNDYYEKLAWAGLESSQAYQNKSQIDKNSIQKAILDERHNRSGAKSTKCPR